MSIVPALCKRQVGPEDVWNSFSHRPITVIAVHCWLDRIWNGLRNRPLHISISIILITLILVGGPIYCGWHHSLARILHHINGENELGASMHTLFSVSDCRWDVAVCFKLLTPLIFHHNRLNPWTIRHNNLFVSLLIPFLLKLFLLECFYQNNKKSNKKKYPSKRIFFSIESIKSTY